MATLTCKRCGGMNIETLAWVDANTNDYTNFFEGDILNCWCRDCEDYVELELKEKRVFEFTSSYKIEAENEEEAKEKFANESHNFAADAECYEIEN